MASIQEAVEAWIGHDVLIQTNEDPFEGVLVHVSTFHDGTLYGVCRTREELENQIHSDYVTSWYVRFQPYPSGDFKTMEVTLDEMTLDPTLWPFLQGLPISLV